MSGQVDDTRMLNETLFEYLSTPSQEKRALDAVTDFTRTKMREDGFYRNILPAVQVSNDDLTRQVHTDKPCIVVDKEPDSPAAISLPFGSLPLQLYIRGPRYLVTFDRIMTPRFTKDVDELRTYHMDIRQVLSDNSIKDMLAEEDGKFISAVNAAMVGADTVVPQSGVVQWETIPGGITRDTLQDSFKIMPRNPSRFEVNTCLTNNLTIREIMKFGRDEMGGDYSQDVLKNGWSSDSFMNAKWVVTIKHELVPEDTIFFFADPRAIGKSYILEDTSMYVHREAFMLEFFAYETIGGAIGNSSGLARADFV